MLRKIIELKLGSMINSKFRQVLDFTETDMRINHLASRERTSFQEFIGIKVSCFVAMGRGNAA